MQEWLCFLIASVVGTIITLIVNWCCGTDESTNLNTIEDKSYVNDDLVNKK